MKKNVIIILLLFLSVNLFAERVDKNTAMKVAKTIVNKADLNEIATRNYSNMYIFSGENSFVIVSADDRVSPIIGYSDSNPFAINDATVNINYWLRKINNDIQIAIDNKAEATEEIRNEWETLIAGNKLTPKSRSAVEALMKTQWNQDDPYNNLCPGGSMTGCAATAMSQVMKYWNWPLKGVGTHTYLENDYGLLSVNYGKTLYDWHNMTNTYSNKSTDIEEEAVATIMYHCGVALNMNYSPEGSGAYPSDVSAAFKRNFNYKSSTIHDEVVFDYSSTQWINMLKEELDNGRPIVYNGWDTNNGGHSFVCDGYDENNLFHFNWGWGGYCDGNYAIGELNPGTGGIGSGSGEYNEKNFITLGIEPNVNDDNDFYLTAYSDGYEPTMRLSWYAYHTADSYNLYRIEDNNETLINNVSGDTFLYIDTELEYDKEYCYIVKSVVGGVENDESNESCATITYTTCLPPSGLHADVTENDPNFNMKFKVEVSWEHADNAVYYIVYADGRKYQETSENQIVIGTNKKSTIEFAVQSICNNEFESDMSESLTVKVEPVGLDEYESNLEIFPNPANDKLFINSDVEIEEINIYNIVGVKVYNEQNFNDNYINVANLNNGIYIINITTAYGNIVRRFVKE